MRLLVAGVAIPSWANVENVREVVDALSGRGSVALIGLERVTATFDLDEGIPTGLAPLQGRLFRGRWAEALDESLPFERVEGFVGWAFGVVELIEEIESELVDRGWPAEEWRVLDDDYDWLAGAK